MVTSYICTKVYTWLEGEIDRFVSNGKVIIIIFGLVSPYRSKQIQETHTACSALLNEKQSLWLHSNFLSVKPCMLCFIRILPHILCTAV